MKKYLDPRADRTATLNSPADSIRDAITNISRHDSDSDEETRPLGDWDMDEIDSLAVECRLIYDGLRKLCIVAGIDARPACAALD